VVFDAQNSTNFGGFRAQQIHCVHPSEMSVILLFQKVNSFVPGLYCLSKKGAVVELEKEPA